MRLKPSLPITELLVPSFLALLSIKQFFVGMDENGELMFGAGILLLLMAFLSIYWINRSYKVITFRGRISIAGYFWGHVELETNEIRGYKLIEVKRGKRATKDFKLVLFDKAEHKILEVTQGDYKSRDWDEFINKLRALNIEFLGQEDLIERWEKSPNK